MTESWSFSIIMSWKNLPRSEIIMLDSVRHLENRILVQRASPSFEIQAKYIRFDGILYVNITVYIFKGLSCTYILDKT
jgi:hypothetical protein